MTSRCYNKELPPFILFLPQIDRSFAFRRVILSHSFLQSHLFIMIKSLIAVLALTASAFAEPKVHTAPAFPHVYQQLHHVKNCPRSRPRRAGALLARLGFLPPHVLNRPQFKLSRSLQQLSRRCVISVLLYEYVADSPKLWSTATFNVITTWTTTQNVNTTVSSTTVTTKVQTGKSLHPRTWRVGGRA